MFQIKDLRFSFNPQREFSFPDVEVADGENLLILGASGVGKTTLMHLMAGLLRPKQGTIVVNGTQLTQLKPRELDRFRGQHLGIIFQRPHFIRSLSTLENLLLLQHLAKTPKNKGRAIQVLTDLGIAAQANQKPYTLSQGEQQRASIAMAVLNQPQIILADEPTASLDDLHCEKVLDLLIEESEKNGAQLIIITHDQRVKNRFKRHITL